MTVTFTRNLRPRQRLHFAVILAFLGALAVSVPRAGRPAQSSLVPRSRRASGRGMRRAHQRHRQRTAAEARSAGGAVRREAEEIVARRGGPRSDLRTTRRVEPGCGRRPPLRRRSGPSDDERYDGGRRCRSGLGRPGWDARADGPWHRGRRRRFGRVASAPRAARPDRREFRFHQCPGGGGRCLRSWHAVAGTIAGSDEGGYAGVAPGAHIVSLRVLEGDGSGETSDVIAAIDWAIENQRGVQTCGYEFVARAPGL